MGSPAISPKLGNAHSHLHIPVPGRWRACVLYAAHHTCPQRNHLVDDGESMSQRPTAAGARAQSLPKGSNAVRPNALHGDDSESLAVSLQESMRGCSSRIANTVTQPAAPLALLKPAFWLRRPSTRGRSDIAHTVVAKDEVTLFPQDLAALKRRHCNDARAGLPLRNCIRLCFLWKTTAPKVASHMPTDRLEARAGPPPVGSDQIRLFGFCP